jgi:hypothetical protein
MECLPKEEIGQASIVILPFPFLDRPESKVRPALVISNSKFNSATDNLVNNHFVDINKTISMPKRAT